MLEISKKERIIVLIDYFTRKVYAKLLTSKESYKILEFIKKIYEELKFKVLQADNGKEFLNNQLERWLEQNNIEHKITIPYYHANNGRVERMNRTIRNAMKKTKGVKKIELAKIIRNYNNILHRGIGMSPNDAMLPENKLKVLENSIKYAKEFKRYFRKHEKFKIGQKVILKNELRSTKMEPEFKGEATIIKDLGKDKYIVKLKNGKEFIKHATQMKCLSGGGWTL